MSFYKLFHNGCIPLKKIIHDIGYDHCNYQPKQV